jgi:hypothetical protein
MLSGIARPPCSDLRKWGFSINVIFDCTLFLQSLMCITRDQTVHFAYVTSSWIEGKQMHLLCKPNTLPSQEVRQRAMKYCHWKIMLKVWRVCASLSATPSIPLIPLPFTSSRRRAHRFTLTTVNHFVVTLLLNTYGGCNMSHRLCCWPAEHYAVFMLYHFTLRRLR